jgi:hypothetical protein
MRSLPMTETPPDRLSADPTSPFYDAALLERGVGVRFKGQEKTNVEEYCVSEGWVRLAAGNTRDRKGRPLTIKLKGEVVAYFREGGGSQ